MEAAAAARYADGSLPEPDAWSLEKHVETCSRCASAVSASVGATPTAPVLADVRETVLHTAGTVPRTRTPRRLARIVWAAGPALRGAWLGALLAVCAAAVLMAYGSGSPNAQPLLLVLAPVLPPAGVALSYGPCSDPAYEIISATPSGGLRLLLTRTAAVLGVSLPVLTCASALLAGPRGEPGAAAWLLPGLALTTGTLVLGSYVGCRRAAGLVGAGWICALLLPVLAVRAGGGGQGPDGLVPVTVLIEQLSRYLSGAAAQASWAAAATLCGGLLVLRRRAFDFHTGPGSDFGFRFGSASVPGPATGGRGAAGPCPGREGES